MIKDDVFGEPVCLLKTNDWEHARGFIVARRLITRKREKILIVKSWWSFSVWIEGCNHSSSAISPFVCEKCGKNLAYMRFHGESEAKGKVGRWVAQTFCWHKWKGGTGYHYESRFDECEKCGKSREVRREFQED